MNLNFNLRAAGAFAAAAVANAAPTAMSTLQQLTTAEERDATESTFPVHALVAFSVSAGIVAVGCAGLSLMDWFHKRGSPTENGQGEEQTEQTVHFFQEGEAITMPPPAYTERPTDQPPTYEEAMGQREENSATVPLIASQQTVPSEAPPPYSLH